METVELQNNLLIAAFMDGKKSKMDGKGKWIRFPEKHAGTDFYAFWPSNLKYHTSFDWLMPVVGKCKEVHFEITGYGFMDSAIPDALTSVDIYKLWLAVIAFIKWYNTTTLNK